MWATNPPQTHRQPSRRLAQQLRGREAQQHGVIKIIVANVTALRSRLEEVVSWDVDATIVSETRWIRQGQMGSQDYSGRGDGSFAGGPSSH